MKSRLISTSFAVVFAAAALLGTPCSLAQTQVKVGMSNFLPYIEVERPDAPPRGMAVEILDVFNGLQKEYLFVPVPTSPRRRIEDFKEGQYDMSMFDDAAWGWAGLPVDVSVPYLAGAEVYIALAKPGREQSYFDDFQGKRMIGMLGYHYGFAKFNADPEYLRQIFRMEFTTNNEASIRMMLAGRGDIAIVTDALLNIYLRKHPEDKPKILVSRKVDQAYRHTIIIRRGIRPSVGEINDLLARLKASPKFAQIARKYGVEPD